MAIETTTARAFADPRRFPFLIRCSIAVLLSLAVRTAGQAATISVTGLPGTTYTFTIGLTSPIGGTPDPQSVSFTGAQIAANQHVRFSVKADASTFSLGSVPCSFATWTADNAVNGSGSSGTMDSASWGVVFIGAAGATSGSFDVHWSLTAPTPLVAGGGTLNVRWQIDFF
jgi:hypothetical protein